MKTIVHVNQHKIKSNRKHGETCPVLTVKTYKSNDYAHEAVIYGQDGGEAARVVYRPEKPLSCGAHVWIETQGRVEVVVRGAPTQEMLDGWKEHIEDTDRERVLRMDEADWLDAAVEYAVELGLSLGLTSKEASAWADRPELFGSLLDVVGWWTFHQEGERDG